MIATPAANTPVTVLAELVPLVITEWVAASIVWWRVGLLLSTRRGISREGKSGHVD